MTDDQTRANETPMPDATPPTEATNLAPAAAASGPAVGAGVSAAPGPNRLRLLAGLGVAGLILVLTAGALFLMGNRTTPEALKYIPADSAAVFEVRMDLPGDQMQKLGNLLARFPGFADQSTLPAKLDEAFTQLVRSASDGEADYVADVKPWLNGPLFLAADAAAMGDAPGASERFLAAATTNGAVACASTFEGQPTKAETYKGIQLTLTTDDTMACGLDGRFAVAGDPASVREALDTRAAGNGMDTSATYLDARKTLAGDQLATAWFSGDALQSAAPASPDPSLPIPAIPGLDALASAVPDWFMLGVRAEDDAAVVELVSAPLPAATAGPSLLPMPAGHASALLGLAPADTLVYVEHQGTGVALQNLLTSMGSVPELQEALGMLGGLTSPADLVGWVDDAAILVSAEGADLASVNPRVTVLLAAKDAASASEKVTTLKTLLGFLGVGGQGITVTDTQVGDVTATTVTITDLGSLLPPGTIPGTTDLPTGELTFSIAAKDRVVYLAIGGGTIEKVLGVQAGASLADDPGFKQATARGLANSQATMYVAAGAAIDFVEPFLPADVAAQWATDIKPYVDPIQSFASWTTSDANGMRFRSVLTVTQP